jgi:hypothetical protein
MRRAQSIALNTVIIAALALLVLVVLALIFSGKIKIFGNATRDCKNMGGDCERDGCEPNEADISNTNCANHCCVDIYTSADDNTN